MCVLSFLISLLINIVMSTPLNTHWPPNPQLVPTPLHTIMMGEVSVSVIVVYTVRVCCPRAVIVTLPECPVKQGQQKKHDIVTVGYMPKIKMSMVLKDQEKYQLSVCMLEKKNKVKPAILVAMNSCV